MTKTFTLNDLVRYLYRETTKTESKDLENALLCNNDLLDFYVELESLQRMMDNIRKSPSKQVVESIIDYSNSCNPILS